MYDLNDGDVWETVGRRVKVPRTETGTTVSQFFKEAEMITKIEFESDAKYITAWDNSGNVVIRCNFDYTDCGDEESLPEFIERHGGLNDCARYLRACYWYSTN